MIKKIHEESPDKGERMIRDDLERYHETKVNDKRVLRICRNRDIKSAIKYSNNGCTRQADNPYYIAENLLNSELKHRHGYDVASSSSLIGIEMQGAMTIFAVNLKRIIKLIQEK